MIASLPLPYEYIGYFRGLSVGFLHGQLAYLVKDSGDGFAKTLIAPMMADLRTAPFDRSSKQGAIHKWTS